MSNFAAMKGINNEILRIAIPNIISNITVPLMGIVSTAIAGHYDSNSVRTIGAHSSAWAQVDSPPKPTERATTRSV